MSNQLLALFYLILSMCVFKAGVEGILKIVKRFGQYDIWDILNISLDFVLGCMWIVEMTGYLHV